MYCYHCGKEIPDNAKYCPYCSTTVIDKHDDSQNQTNANNAYTYSSSHADMGASGKPPQKWYQTTTVVVLLLIFCFPLGIALMWINKKWNLVARIIISVIFAIGLVCTLFGSGANITHDEPESTKEETTNESEPETDELEDVETDSTEKAVEPNDQDAPEQAEIPNYDNLSEEEYKNSCQEMWHDDIFFSKDDLNGKLVKLDLFVNDERFFATEAFYDYSASQIINEHDLKRDILVCGVKRSPEEYSYVGGEVYLYFSNKYAVDPLSISAGNHLIIYGQIINYSSNTTSGYNDCRIIPKYIQNNG